MKYYLLMALLTLSAHAHTEALYDHKAIKGMSGEYWRESTVKDIQMAGNKIIILNNDGSGIFHFVKSDRKIPFKWGATLKNGNTIKQAAGKAHPLVGACDLVTLDTGKTREFFCINKDAGYAQMTLGIFIKRTKDSGKGPWNIK